MLRKNKNWDVLCLALLIAVLASDAARKLELLVDTSGYKLQLWKLCQFHDSNVKTSVTQAIRTAHHLQFFLHFSLEVTAQFPIEVGVTIVLS
jgi:hypothetical protein